MRIIPVFRPAFQPRQMKDMFISLVLRREPAGDMPAVFEREFARYIGVRHAVSVPSGRWGLYYILRGLGFSEGDEIIVPAFTFGAVSAVIRKLGLRPVFADTSPGSLNIDPKEIEARISPRTRAMIPAHLCGFPCQMEEIQRIGEKHGIAVIEDCCQSLGASYKGRKTGAWGEASFFTFGTTKHFTTLGGGMVATDNQVLAERIRGYTRHMRPAGSFRLFLKALAAFGMAGVSSRALFPCAYAVLRLCSILGIDPVDQIFREKGPGAEKCPDSGGIAPVFAALGIEQLRALDADNALRKKQGAVLYAGIRGARDIRVPLLLDEAENIFSSCPLLAKNREGLRKKLLRRGVDTSAGYMHYAAESGCPHAAANKREVVYLPLYPELTDDEAAYIRETVRNVSG